MSFKVLAQIRKLNEIIITYNTFTKLPLLYKKKINLKFSLKIMWEKNWSIYWG